MSDDLLASIRKEWERPACAYLLHCGYTDIQYEPYGQNSPPDFVINKRIAVEASRLNQSHNEGNSMKGLETGSNASKDSMEKLLTSLGPPMNGQSWYVFHDFSRPLPTKKILRRLENTLRAFMAEADPQPFRRNFGDNLEIEILRAGKIYSTFFVQGGQSDGQSGGWLIEEMEKNLNFRIAEKTQKIAKVRQKYPEWWLVLSDFVGYGLDHFDQLFRDRISLTSHSFDKIILVAPHDHTRAFEVWPGHGSTYVTGAHTVGHGCVGDRQT